MLEIIDTQRCPQLSINAPHRKTSHGSIALTPQCLSRDHARGEDADTQSLHHRCIALSNNVKILCSKQELFVSHKAYFEEVFVFLPNNTLRPILSDTMYLSNSFRQSTPPKNRQLNVSISNSERKGDDFGER